MRFLLILSILCFSCQGKASFNKQNINDTCVVSLSITSDHNNLRIENTIGILTTSENYQFGDTIKIYNQKQQIISEVIRKEEYQIIVFKCLEKDSLSYKIQMENGAIGYIPYSFRKMEFQTWEKHILNMFSVDFDEIKNPLKKEPYIDAENLNYDNDEFYHPYSIKGEWLQVKWGYTNNWEYGWIKWTENGKLIIQPHFFA